MNSHEPYRVGLLSATDRGMPAGTSSLAMADGHRGFVDPKDSMDQLASGLSTLKVLL